MLKAFLKVYIVIYLSSLQTSHNTAGNILNVSRIQTSNRDSGALGHVYVILICSLSAGCKGKGLDLLLPLSLRTTTGERPRNPNMPD
jgi:hypothetical protein